MWLLSHYLFDSFSQQPQIKYTAPMQGWGNVWTKVIRTAELGFALSSWFSKPNFCFFNCLRGFLEREFSQGEQEWMEDSHEGLSFTQTTPYCQNIVMTTQPKIHIIQNVKWRNGTCISFRLNVIDNNGTGEESMSWLSKEKQRNLQESRVDWRNPPLPASTQASKHRISSKSSFFPVSETFSTISSF